LHLHLRLKLNLLLPLDLRLRLRLHLWLPLKLHLFLPLLLHLRIYLLLHLPLQLHLSRRQHKEPGRLWRRHCSWGGCSRRKSRRAGNDSVRDCGGSGYRDSSSGGPGVNRTAKRGHALCHSEAAGPSAELRRCSNDR
jgi:hypothetical protein